MCDKAIRLNAFVTKPFVLTACTPKAFVLKALELTFVLSQAQQYSANRHS